MGGFEQQAKNLNHSLTPPGHWATTKPVESGKMFLFRMSGFRQNDTTKIWEIDNGVVFWEFSLSRHYSRVDSLLALRSIQQSPPFLCVYAFRKSFGLYHNVAVWSVWEINLYLLSCPLAATKWKRIPSTSVDGRNHSHSVSWLALVVQNKNSRTERVWKQWKRAPVSTTEKWP